MSTLLRDMAKAAVKAALEEAMESAIDGTAPAARVTGAQVIAAAKHERARLLNNDRVKRHRDKKRLATQQARVQALAIAAAGAADRAAAALVANVAPPPAVDDYEIDGPGVPGYAGDEADFELDDFESDDDSAGPSVAPPEPMQS